VKAKLPQVILALCLAILYSGCGGTHHSKGKLVFKGQVAHVEYRLDDHTTVVTDAEGKTVHLHGHPAIPCADIEIYQEGDHEYEVFRLPPPTT
jgi:hypothetical protein